MHSNELDRLVREADELHAADPGHFDPPGYPQPPRVFVEEAEGFLGEDAPWHRVAHVAHALDREDAR